MRLGLKLNRLAGAAPAGETAQPVEQAVVPSSSGSIVRSAGTLPAVRDGLVRRLPLPAPVLLRSPRQTFRTMSFLAVVLLPVAVAAAYYFAVAADQYVAEFRFTLSTAEPSRLDPLSLLAGNAAQSPATTEAQILVQYIASRAMFDEADAALDLRRLFSPPGADWWARSPQGATIEELVHYWKGQVDPFYEPASGTIAVRVRAFAAADALRLAQTIVAACERLVNDLSARARRDALHHAEAELSQSESRLKSVLGEIRAFRDREGLIDPARTAEATGLLSTRLRDDLLRAKADLATLKNYMRDDAPS